MGSDLSKEQQEVYDMLTNDYETPKNIAIRRKTSVTAVYKTINKLKKKGYLTQGFTRGLKRVESTKLQPSKLLKKYIRLHGMEFNIKIINKSDNYSKLEKNEIIFIDGNTIRLYENSIELYSNEHLDFKGEDEWRATALAMHYWQKIFTQIENRLKIIIVKEGYQNIRLVNSHYAEVNNEIAEECNKDKVKLNVYTTNEGKLWFKIDFSWNENEAETVHPDTSKPDMGRVKAVFNDIRDNDSYLPSKTKQNIDTTAHLLKSTTDNLMTVGHLITGNTTMIQRMESGFMTLSEMILQMQARIDELSKGKLKGKSKAHTQYSLLSYMKL